MLTSRLQQCYADDKCEETSADPTHRCCWHRAPCRDLAECRIHERCCPKTIAPMHA